MMLFIKVTLLSVLVVTNAAAHVLQDAAKAAPQGERRHDLSGVALAKSEGRERTTPSVISTSTAGVITVPLDDLYLSALDSLTKGSPYYMQRGLLTRKKDNTALILLSGLAQACAAAGQAAGGQTAAEKQQGVLNVASTIFATSAALVADKQKQRSPETAGLITRLAQQLEQQVSADSNLALRMPLSDTMTLFHALPDAGTKELFVQLMLKSPEFSELFLNDLFAAAWSFLSLYNNLITGVIDANVRAVVNKWQHEMVASDNVLLNQLHYLQGAMIIAAPQAGKPLSPQVVDKIVALVSARLKTVFSNLFENIN